MRAGLYRLVGRLVGRLPGRLPGLLPAGLPGWLMAGLALAGLAGPLGTLAAQRPAAGQKNDQVTANLTGPLKWTVTGPMVSAMPDAKHAVISVKDPTVVRWRGKWLVYATTADRRGAWNMEFLTFKNWRQAGTAKPYFMDATPGFAGYHCAPELFYFRPQKKWYLIYQSGPPTYSTADDPSKPESWTKPQPLFASRPATVSAWLDFWVICDRAKCYLFFSGDNGNFYRSETWIGDFPKGWSTPRIAMHAGKAGDLYEASNTYRLKGRGEYLTLIEAMGGKTGKRYFRAFVASRLDGAWKPLAQASTWDEPFLGEKNVSFAPGVAAWTSNLSHGEMIRAGFDEKLEIDPKHLEFVFQGVSAGDAAKAANYSQIPWQLGIARQQM